MVFSFNKKFLWLCLLFLQVDLGLLSTVKLLLALSTLSFLVGCFIWQYFTVVWLEIDQSDVFVPRFFLHLVKALFGMWCFQQDRFKKIVRYYMNMILHQTDIVRQESSCLPHGYLIKQFLPSSELNFGLNSIIMLCQEFSKVTHR